MTITGMWIIRFEDGSTGLTKDVDVLTLGGVGLSGGIPVTNRPPATWGSGYNLSANTVTFNSEIHDLSVTMMMGKPDLLECTRRDGGTAIWTAEAHP
jgi:hypothetical protein